MTADTAPFSVTGSQTQTITLPAVATLTVTAGETIATGDLASRGVQIRWTHYRGPGKVTFTPAISAYGKPVTSETKVSFSEPGDYRFRAIATDGGLFWTYDVDVKVKASTSARLGQLNPSAGERFVRPRGSVVRELGGAAIIQPSWLARETARLLLCSIHAELF